MEFKDIFNEDGLYVGDDFAPGMALKVKDGVLSYISYVDENDLFPATGTATVYKNLFYKKYRKVYTIKQLFE